MSTYYSKRNFELSNMVVVPLSSFSFHSLSLSLSSLSSSSTFFFSGENKHIAHQSDASLIWTSGHKNKRMKSSIQVSDKQKGSIWAMVL